MKFDKVRRVAPEFLLSVHLEPTCMRGKEKKKKKKRKEENVLDAFRYIAERIWFTSLDGFLDTAKPESPPPTFPYLLPSMFLSRCDEPLLRVFATFNDRGTALCESRAQLAPG